MADRFGATRALVSSLSLLTLLLALLPLATHDLLPGLPALVLWGAAGASFFAPQQHRLLSLASKHTNVILALNNSAFYLGTAGGAALGGVALRFLPMTQLGWVGASSAFLALLLVLLQPVDERDRFRQPRHAQPGQSAKERKCFMKSYHINIGAGLAGLTIREHEIPVPGPRDVLVQVQASSLSFRELMILLLGYYPLPIRPDVVPVSDGAGVVVAVGQQVTRVKVGEPVAGALFPYWLDGPFTWGTAAQLGGSLDGMLTEYALLPEEGVVPIPEHLSFEEAAALPCVGVTAWNALTGGRPLQAGETVLTLGSGGVSLFALQFAKRFGARVIATTSSEEKAERLKALGADEVINYRVTPEWHVAVRELTGGRGVDRVVEVGGPGTLEQSIKSTTFSGEIALVGSLAREAARSETTALTLVRTAIAGVVTLRSVAAGSRAQFTAMNRAIALHRLQPVIDRVFPFDDAQAAYQYYAEAHPFGKVIISHR